jgi:hypothetical protein
MVGSQWGGKNSMRSPSRGAREGSVTVRGPCSSPANAYSTRYTVYALGRHIGSKMVEDIRAQG